MIMFPIAHREVEMDCCPSCREIESIVQEIGEDIECPECGAVIPCEKEEK